jgi:hypothetical protein
VAAVTTTTHPLANTYRTLASGREVFIDAKGLATLLDEDCGWDEGPTCSICDALGHGYPGGGPCPLEDSGWYDPEEERERYFEGLAEARQEARYDASDEAREWGGEDRP